jgi:polyhydroxybutyrate depolymerase
MFSYPHTQASSGQERPEEVSLRSRNTGPAQNAIRIKQKYFIFAGGAIRTYSLHVPMGYEAGTPTPLVINLHGIAADAEGQERLSGMSHKSDEEGFIVAYPEALGSPSAWKIGACQGCATDLAFLRALIEHLRARLSIDQARIYATGMSNGGGMVNRMACEMSDMIAAIGAVSGAYPIWNNYRPTRPIPVVAFHGTADRVVPYEGLGHVLPPVRAWAAGWAARNGCDPTPTITYRRGRVSGETWSDCSGKATVTLYTIEEGGHDWPGSEGCPADIVATDMIWDFFAGHPMP